ncbi:MAG: TolC family protein [Phycisphaerales bacterium]|nr:MAG: TolC family protein [Phycisphaerales bacterium]
MTVLLDKVTAVLCGMTLTFQTLLVSSCASVPPDDSSHDVASEVRIEKPQSNLTETPDSNETPAPEGPLRIGIQEAILLAMENNQALIVERMNPQIQRTFEQEELAVFDPLLSPQVSNRRTVTSRLSRAGSSTENSTVNSINGSILLDKLFPTGTALDLEASTSYTDHSLYSDTFTANRLGFTVTQALLRGMDVQANMARVNQARFDTLISQYELRGFTEILLEQVELKFWDHALAQRQIDIYTDSLNLAEKQMAETQERIKIGDLAETELAAAQAEVALGRENLINARSTLARERLDLLRLLNPSGSMNWDRQIVLQYETSLPEINLEDVEEHVQVALRMRPDLNQARLEIQRGDLEVVRTKNGLLPKMDMFISFGKTGYADTFDRALDDMDEDRYDVTWGLVLETAPLNRGERARYSRAVLGRQQLRKALENLSQLVQVDVRAAHIEVTRAQEQIAATTATRNFQEEKLRAETEKFRVGKSTSLLVGQAQRDFVASQIAEIEAVANYLKALVSLYRLEGSLLHRRGLSAPGAEPVVLEPQE